MPDPRITVLGVGNTLMGDDAFGLRVLAQLEQRWEIPAFVRLVDGGVWGLSLLPDVEDAEVLIIVDAITANRPAGTVIRLDDDEVPRVLFQKLSPHEVDLREVLALAEFTGRHPRKLVAIGVQPEVIALCTELSPVVARQVEPVADLIAEELARHGAPCAGRRTLAHA